MSALAAHELARSRDCKVFGCTRVAPTRGRYAGYCDEHRGMRRVAQESANAVRPAPIVVAPVVAVPSLKEAAQKLVPVAAELDKALLRKRTANGEAKRAFDAFKAAFEEIQATAKAACG